MLWPGGGIAGRLPLRRLSNGSRKEPSLYKEVSKMSEPLEVAAARGKVIIGLRQVTRKPLSILYIPQHLCQEKGREV
jgi:hypothetical protein